MSESKPDAPTTSNPSQPGAGNDKGSAPERKRRRRRRVRRSDGAREEGERTESRRGESSDPDGGAGSGNGSRRRRSRRGRGKADGPTSERDGGPSSEASGVSDASGDSGESGRRRRRRRRRDGDSEADDSTRGTGSRDASQDRDQARGDDRGRKRKRKRRRGDRSRDAESSSRSREPHEATDTDGERLDGARAVSESDQDDRDASEDAGERGTADRYRASAGARRDTDEHAADEEELPEGFFAVEETVARPEPEADDPDPLTAEFEDADDDENHSLETQVRRVVGVKFATAGRIVFYESGKEHFERGEEIVVQGDRPPRLGTVAVPTTRREVQRGQYETGVRRPSMQDRAHFETLRARADELLEQARAMARQQELPIKVYRLELSHTGKKAQVYFSTEERIDHRDWIKRLSKRLGVRVEIRQTGVRDEAKAVGGIGSCGLELCCSTWLPEFVPVSIKMAKDQGMVLNPTKVSGQCGRLKCCLVYEQETYAALRKGLPKLGKRVITEAGEGRVVEVDVLRQRVRVSLGPGEFQVFPGHEVKPMFPSQQQQQKKPS